MIITAKYASVCPCCSQRIVPGTKVEWAKGSPAKHGACSQGPAATVSAAPAPARRGSNWDPSRFNGYGRAKGGFRKSCISGGDCSSIGTGRSCGGHDCDGF
jgi:hypothetical protein